MVSSYGINPEQVTIPPLDNSTVREPSTAGRLISSNSPIERKKIATSANYVEQFSPYR